MLSNEQKHADSERVHGPHKSDHADGVKVTLATSALILYIATQASSYEAQLVKKKNSLPRPITVQPMGDCHSSANEKSLYFQLSISSKSIKEHSSPLFPWINKWFAIRPHVLNCNSLLFRNKPIFLEKSWLFVKGQHVLPLLPTRTLQGVYSCSVGMEMMV